MSNKYKIVKLKPITYKDESLFIVDKESGCLILYLVLDNGVCSACNLDLNAGFKLAEYLESEKLISEGYSDEEAEDMTSNKSWNELAGEDFSFSHYSLDLFNLDQIFLISKRLAVNKFRWDEDVMDLDLPELVV